MKSYFTTNLSLPARCLVAASILLCASVIVAQEHSREELFKVTGSDTNASDEFGISVAVSGNIAVVGSPLDGQTTGDSGAAYVFDVATQRQRYKLTPTDNVGYGEFGHAVAIEDNIAIVGSSGTTSSVGAAYVFDLNTGQQLFKLTGSDSTPQDWFGLSVALSGNIAIVGAQHFMGPGSAYLFDLTTGREVFKLSASDAAAGDLFGVSVGISGSTAIVGARRDDDHGESSGSAYLFDVATGEQLAKLTGSDAAAQSNFGRSVAIRDDVAVVGSTGPAYTSGSAYMFDVNTGQELGKLSPPDSTVEDYFGWSVGISDHIVVVGSPFLGLDDFTDETSSAFLFEMSTGRELAQLMPHDTLPSHHLGYAVGISGDIVVVGAPWDDDRGVWAGAAYFFSAVPESNNVVILGIGAGVIYLASCRRRE